MIEATEREWKQFCEGIARELIGPFEWEVSVQGTDRIREYLDGDTVVARMRVCDCISDKHALECERIFEVEKALLLRVSFIYIPTDEEWEAWEAEDFETNTPVAQRVIQLREEIEQALAVGVLSPMGFRIKKEDLRIYELALDGTYADGMIGNRKVEVIDE